MYGILRSDRLLAYEPIISPNVKPSPARLNTKGKAPSGRNVGILADLLAMPLDVFYRVRNCIAARLGILLIPAV